MIGDPYPINWWKRTGTALNPKVSGDSIGSDSVPVGDIFAKKYNTDTGYTITGSEPTGTTYWDSANGTLSTVLANGVIYQHGKELYIDGQNDTGVQINNGTPVEYASAIGNSGNFRIQPASAAAGKAPFLFVGLVTEDIADGSVGKITTTGKVRGISTDGSAVGETWADGEILYVSETSGQLTNVAPNAPVPAIPVALVISAHATNGTLEVRPTFPTSLEMLSDVDGATAINGSVLYYDNASSVWDKSQNLTWIESTQDLSVVGAVTIGDQVSDFDYTLNGNGSEAYKYDWGLDYHLFSGDWESDQFKYLDASTGALNSFYIGQTGSSTGEGNYLWGEGAGNGLTNGTYNFFAGHQAGYTASTALRNVAIGFRSLYTNSTGSRNIAIGYQALNMATGSYNLAVGNQAGQSISTGQYNTIFGSDAATSLTTGSSNFVLGSLSAQALVSGNQNVIIGADALRTAHNKNNTVGIGWQAGRNANTASSVLIGREAGYSETADNRLHVANNQTESLIEGQFDNRYLKVNGILQAEALRETTSELTTSTTLTHTITYGEQTTAGITTTLWATPTTGDKVRIHNSSGAVCYIDGNGETIGGTTDTTVAIYDGETLDLVYGYSYWTA